MKPASGHQPLASSGLGVVIEHAPGPMAAVERADYIVRCVNPAFCRLMDQPAEQLVGRPFAEMMPASEVLALLDRVYRTGQAESYTAQQHAEPHPLGRAFTMWPVLADECPVWVIIQVTEPAQVHDRIVAMNEALVLGSLRQHEFAEAADTLNLQLQREIGERTQVESALRVSEEHFRTLFELGPTAVYSCDASGVIQNFNRRAAELWGREPGRGDTDERFCGSFRMFRLDGSFVPHAQCPMAEVVSGKIAEVHDAEVLIERPDGSRVSVVVNILPLKNQHGKITGAINCFYDVTERKDAEQRQILLTDELAHRGKNLLAVVLAITSRSLSGTRSLTEARDVLIQRLHALARSQSMLISASFKGAPVAEIVRLESETFAGQVKAAGPHVMLKPRVAQTLTLLVHELATNATKYGALSRPEGQIAIQWSIVGVGAEAQFRFQWQERNGPRVVPPTHQGFGRMLLEKAAAHEFGPPKVRFAPEGLTYEIDAPLSVVAANQGRRP